jgi:hypothetical protein
LFHDEVLINIRLRKVEKLSLTYDLLSMILNGDVHILLDVRPPTLIPEGHKFILPVLLDPALGLRNPGAEILLIVLIQARVVISWATVTLVLSAAAL